MAFCYRQSMIHSAFNITENSWWKPEYCEHRGADAVANKIKRLHELVKKVPPDDFLKGYTEHHHLKYLVECISGQNNTKITFEYVERLLNLGNDELQDRRCFHLEQKLRNLHETTVTLFPNVTCFSTSLLEDFDVEFVKAIHCGVGKEIVSHPGEFRTKSAKPAGEGIFYLDPFLIEGELEQLLKECRLAFSEPNLGLLDAIKYGACFLTNFLYIHPFANGNGRTARLLLSYLLRQFTIVPLSLYTSGEMKEVYLQCLRESRYDGGVMKPASLSRFILEAIEEDYLYFCSTMNVGLN